MIRAGEDPRFIFRRMLISACEDVGMADPQALGVVEAAASAFDQVGLPEGQFHLTQAALYLATCPKSNSALAFLMPWMLLRWKRLKYRIIYGMPTGISTALATAKGTNIPTLFGSIGWPSSICQEH